MLAANNLHQMFEELLPFLKEQCPKDQIYEIVNKTNSSGSSPLRKKSDKIDYTVITDSKEMLEKLI